jgi:DNA-directed RNA polymerase subunit M/transcription elongation factor TFIIS
MYRINQKDSNTNSKFGVDQLKEQLVNYIFNVVDLSRFKYELLQFDTELHQLVEKKYFLSANFSGSNCLLIFTKIRDTYHSCLIDRKTLSYNRQKINVNDVNTFPVNLKLDREIYNGTIFDGIYVQGKKKTFVITDVYFFKGQDYTMSKLDSKLLTIFSYLRSNYNENEKNNSIILTVNKLYPLGDIETLVEVDIPKIKDFFVRGIAFYPEKSGTKLIYLYGNENKDTNTGQMMIQPKQPSKQFQPTQLQSSVPVSVQEPVKEQQIKTKKQMKSFYCPKEKQDEEYVFQMKSTEMPDVYLLNIVEPVKKDGKTVLKTVKIGIAFVPTSTRSKWCKDLMKNTNGNVLVHCKFNPEKMTWEPIKCAEAKKPSFVEDFEVVQVEQN